MKQLMACALTGISLAGFGSCAEYSEMAARFPLVDLSGKIADQKVLEKDVAAEGEVWVAPKEVSWALTGKGQRFVTLPDGRLCVVFADAAEGSPTKGDLVAWVGQKENSRCLDSTGTFRLLLLRDHGDGADGCRSLTLTPDGTLVATTKLRYRPGDKDDSLVSVRFRCPEKVTASAEDSFRRRLAHAGEWYLPSRLGVFYHWGLFTDREKGRFRYNTPAEFEAAAVDPEQIGRNMADLAKGMGAKYAVLTLWHTNARHMMLFPTREKSFVNRTTKDYIGPYLRACRAAGLKGLLYFPTDSSTWDADPQHPTIDPRVGPPGTLAFVDCVGRVLDELKERYGDLIDGFWLDGGFPGLTCTFPSKIHSLWPKAIVIGNNHVRMTIPDVDICTTEVCPRWPTQPDYCRPDGYRLTNAFRMPPPPDDLNEDVPTMGEWEWAGLAGLKKPFVEDPNRLVKMIVCSLGQRGRWNCCVGIGPLIDGTGAEPVRKAVDAMGRFVAWAGEAVYGTKGPAGTFFGAGNLYGYGFKGFCSVTQSLSDPNVFYAIVTEAEYTGDNLVLFATNGHTPRRISDLRTGRTYSFATYQSTEVSGVDWSDVKTYGATVLKFEFGQDDVRANGAGEPPVTVDFTAGKGAVKRLNGICNGLPLGKSRDATHCEWFDALEFPEIRFHDQAASNGGQAIADISRVFPLAHADADDPRNYDFKATDDYIALCRRFTDRIEFRIGEQIEHTEHHYRIFPPKDYAKYARVCLNIVRHYNEGWANGFHWNIRRWGIWEEPDNKCLFDGDYEKEFFPLYAAIAKTLKAAYPDLQVGGPSTRGREMFRAEKFVAYCRENEVPLDFCAITEYRRSVDKIIAIGEQTRTILDTNGFAKAEVTMSEWHYEPCRWGGNTPETAKEAWDDCMGIDSAAFTAGVLASGQDSPFDRMFFYATDKGQFGLFDFRECRRGAPWSAFKAFADVARLEERVATTADASRGFYALAAKGADGRGALMLAALRTPEKGPVRVAVRGGLVPGEVLVDAGDRVKRLEPAAGWTFADGVLTLPPVGRSAIWFVGFGDYRARKLACDAPKAEKVVAPLMGFKREDGKLDFALIVDAENRALTAAPVKKMRDDYSYALGETPEVFGDNDNEKLSQVKWHVVFGDSAYARSLGADAKTLKDGEYLIRTFERGVLVVGKDAAANAKALKRLCALLSEGRMTLPKLDLKSAD